MSFILRDMLRVAEAYFDVVVRGFVFLQDTVVYYLPGVCEYSMYRKHYWCLSRETFAYVYLYFIMGITMFTVILVITFGPRLLGRLFSFLAGLFTIFHATTKKEIADHSLSSENGPAENAVEYTNKAVKEQPHVEQRQMRKVARLTGSNFRMPIADGVKRKSRRPNRLTMD